MASGLLSLKWNNHRTTFFHVLSTIRNKESYCDVTIACDGKFYPVHKMVLATCSDYFEQMFEKTSCKHPVIVLKDIRHEDLEALLNYMYLGEVNVLQNELAGLIKAAECLMIKGLAVPDEAPTKDTRENKRSSGGTREVSPQPKRRRREEEVKHSPSHPVIKETKERDPYPGSQNHPLSQKTSSSSSISQQPSRTSSLPPSRRLPSPSPSTGNTSDGHQDDSNQGQIEPELTRSQSIRQTENDRIASQPQTRIPEVILDEPGVKEEPKEVDEEDRELTETKEEHLDSEYSYDPLSEGGESIGEVSGSGTHKYDSQMMPQSMEELVAQAIPGSSGLQGNSVPMWDADGSLQSFSMEGFGGDGAHAPQMIGHRPWRLSAHQTTGKYECSICKSCFLTNSNLTRHQNIHTGEKPYACHLCSYRSNQRSNLKLHISNKHKFVLSDVAESTTSSDLMDCEKAFFSVSETDQIGGAK